MHPKLDELLAPDGQPYERYVVVGTSGSGKSTLAERMSRAWGHAYVELDALHFLPGWRERELEDFAARVDAALEAPGRWVVAGNYSKVRERVWPRAQAIVWLDPSLGRVLWRVTIRSIARIVRDEDLWGTGNRETFQQTFLSRDSIIWWALSTYHRRRRRYLEQLLEDPPARLAVFHVTDGAVSRPGAPEEVASPGPGR